MLVNRHLYRSLLALLLILPLCTAVAGTAMQKKEVSAGMYSAISGQQADHLDDERHPQPLMASWPSVGYSAPPLGIQPGYSGSSGIFAVGAVPSFSLFPIQQHSQTVLRRWRILSAAIHQAHLQALYPEHGFW